MSIDDYVTNIREHNPRPTYIAEDVRGCATVVNPKDYVEMPGMLYKGKKVYVSKEHYARISK